jgi:hypothetical protein
MATIIEYYEVYEGGYTDTLIARFLSKSAADGLANMRPTYYVSKRTQKLVVYDTPEEYLDRYNEEVKQKALAKLTPKERLALGL